MPSDREAAPLRGRAALVTGGTAGIGLAAARRLAARGAVVALAARDTTRGEAAVESLRRDGATAVFLAADVVDPEVCEALPARAAEALGAPVTVLVNAAGGGATDVDLDRTTPERLRAILAANLESTVQVTRAALPAMLAAGGGSVLSVGGVNAVRGMAGAPAYAAAKAGVAAFTRCLAADHAAQGVVAVCVHPGAVLTDRLRAWVALRRSRGEAVDDVERRAVDPAEVGEWIAFLCGPAGVLVNGADLVLERR